MLPVPFLPFFPTKPVTVAVAVAVKMLTSRTCPSHPTSIAAAEELWAVGSQPRQARASSVLWQLMWPYSRGPGRCLCDRGHGRGYGCGCVAVVEVAMTVNVDAAVDRGCGRSDFRSGSEGGGRAACDSNTIT